MTTALVESWIALQAHMLIVSTPPGGCESVPLIYEAIGALGALLKEPTIEISSDRFPLDVACTLTTPTPSTCQEGLWTLNRGLHGILAFDPRSSSLVWKIYR